MKNVILILAITIATVLNSYAAPAVYELQSPDKSVNVKVSVEGGELSYMIFDSGEVILDRSLIAMELASGDILGNNIKRVKRVKHTTIDEVYSSPFYLKSNVEDRCEQMELQFTGNYSVIFRAYNNGVSYRFATNIKGDIVVKNETAIFNLPYDSKLYASHSNCDEKEIEAQFFNSFERFYVDANISKQHPEHLMLTPLLAESTQGRKLIITETDLRSYPGMFLLPQGDDSSVKGVFASYPTAFKQGGHNNIQELVTKRADYIAKCSGERTFPWRIIAIAREDKDLLSNDLAYVLATPSCIEQIDWIKPGQAAWDWWCDWNLSGIDFEAGINTETYKYYIDFASRFGLEYIILDEGWSETTNLFNVVEDVDLEELASYASEKGVDIILWAGYYALAQDLENVVSYFSNMGIKGFKIDFFDRDDQIMVETSFEIAKICAQHKMVIDFHGFPKPSGIQRTYPNVLNFEGVSGLEQLKWCDTTTDMVLHDVIFPFVRMFNGAVDYTQGAMRNAIKSSYYPSDTSPMSQGTRSRQLAEYVIFYSPLSMLCDTPTLYEKEPEIPQFISLIPTVWDESVVLDAAISEQITIARRKGAEWYVGSIVNWEERDIELCFDFLAPGKYNLEIIFDGLNAAKDATDYRVDKCVIDNSSKHSVVCKPGGGFVARITPVK